MKTLTEAVKACGGVFPTADTNHYELIYDTFAQTELIRLKFNGFLFTPEDFKSRADELSGKPEWSEAPMGYDWLWQNADGLWRFGKGPKPQVNGDYYLTHSHDNSTVYCGVVLGDWRDTLEWRPEAKTEPVQSTTWRGMQDGLPPEGTECEFDKRAYFDNGYTADNWEDGDLLEVVAHKIGEGGDPVLVLWNAKNKTADSLIPSLVRPIKPERKPMSRTEANNALSVAFKGVPFSVSQRTSLLDALGYKE